MNTKKEYNLDGNSVRGFLFPAREGSLGLLAANNKVHPCLVSFYFIGGR